MTTTIKTLDVTTLSHAEKERLIFPGIQALGPGERLRIVIEFNPVPLLYLLRARGDLEVALEKEGPDEWVLNIKRTAVGQDQKAVFKELLKEKEASPEAKETARALFQALDATTLGILEQELMREGISHEEIRNNLCDIHLDILKESLISKRVEVHAPHPVHTFMEEHKVILQNLNELGALVEKLKGLDSFEGVKPDLKRLEEIAHHLVEAEIHHQREEEVLFPRIEKRDIVEPPQIMRMDHAEFRARKQELYKLAHSPYSYHFPEFKKKVIELGEYLARELESHIFKEDNILYQIGLQILTPQEWEEIKHECDKIGYCCFTPEDRQIEGKVVELDLRQTPPWERHDKIFAVWDSLRPGQVIKIINDHAPKPLHYQFEAEYKGQYQWENLQEGPRDWIVTVKKV